MNDLTIRQKNILGYIIETYIKTGKPVSSNLLAKDPSLSLTYSSATIRNEMIFLENQKMIKKESNVSGRIPCTSGYKHYFEKIMKFDSEYSKLKTKLNDVLNNRMKSIDEIIDESCEIISDYTNIITLNNENIYDFEILRKIDLIDISDNNNLLIVVTSAGSVYKNKISKKNKLKNNDLIMAVSFFNKYLANTNFSKIKEKLKYLKSIGKKFIVENEQIIQDLAQLIISNIKPKHSITGLNSIVKRHEFKNYDRVVKLIETLDNKSIWQSLSKNKNSTNGIDFKIDSDILDNIEDIAAITKSYKFKSGKKGELTFLGPKRMEYKHLATLLDWFINKIEFIEDGKRE